MEALSSHDWTEIVSYDTLVESVIYGKVMENNSAKDDKEILISTVSDLLDLLEREDEIDVAKLDLDRSLTTIVLRVEGDGYGAFIPGEQTRTLWELQQSFYRLAAFAVHGTTDIRCLTTEERKKFELRIVVKEGSLIGEICTEQYWKELISKVVGKMSGTSLALTIVGCAVVASGYFCFDSHNQRLVQQSQQDANIAIAQQETQRFQVFADAMSEKDALFYKTMMGRTDECIKEVAVQIAKRSPDATTVSIGSVHYDSEEIASFKSRAKSDSEASESMSGIFQIVGVDKSAPSWQLKLRGKFDNEEISVRFAPDAIDGDGEQAKTEILRAFSEDKPVTVDVSIGKKRNLLNAISIQEDN